MKRFTFAILMLATLLPLGAANKVTTVEQVTGTVTLTEDVDYHITSTEPFATTGSIDIINTDHAVIIIDNLRPSKVQNYLSFIKINGEAARINTNCQLRIYNNGAIIYPYPNTIKMLTTYTENNYEGESCDNYRIGNSGGFMITMSTAQLNNRIRSFKLKRGYMVTFAIGSQGKGYSRCFIADDADLEIPVLPNILAARISSYRIFKWNNTSKKGLANDTRAASVSSLNVQSCYSFGLGEDRGLDCECVPHHIYEDWPSATACGGVNYSPHLKTNNEPGNSADDHPQSVNEILANWENLMRTGMRLCSPSSHDGSLNHLRAFMDSIDARGWRCDILDMHCYWPEGSFGNLQGWYNSYKRPIWISEWVWGASWNSNGAFANGVTEAQNAEAIKRICTNLNSWDYIERYYYWNSERDPSKILKDNGSLTAAGRYYRDMNTGLGYKASYEYVPKAPKVKNPRAFTATYNPVNNNCTLRWTDENGELLDSIFIEVKTGSGEWERLANIDISDTKYTYNYSYKNAVPGNYAYRIHTIDFNKANHYSAETYNIITNTESLNDGNIQVGTVTTQTSNESYNFFAAPFDEVPAVVFGSVSNYNSKAGLVERINTNYTKDDKYNAVTSSIIPLTYGSETSFYRGTEYSSFLATKPGTGKIGSLSYEAAITEPIQVGDTLEYTFEKPFSDAPVVMVTPIYTTNTYPLLWRVFDVTTTGFRVVLQRQAGVASNVAKISAKLALFAIETGKQQLEDGTTLIAGNGDFTFTSTLITQKDIEYGDSLNEPKVLVQLQSLNRKVAGNLRTQINAPGATKTAVRLHLDASDNANNAVSARNPVEERLGWIVVGKPFNIDDAICQPKSVLHQLVAYPSVVTTTFGVRDDDATKASVYSSNGQLLKTMELTQGQATIDISSLPAGIYLVRTNAQHSTKIIKK